MYVTRLLSQIIVLVGFLSYCVICQSLEHSTDTANRHTQSCQYDHKNGQLDKTDIQVVVWNVFKGKKEGWRHQLDAFNGTNTIFMTQEMPEDHLVEQGLGQNQKWHYSPGFVFRNRLTGVMTSATAGSTFSCLLSHTEPWLRTPKASLITRYPLSDMNQQLMVANVHAINYTLGAKAFSNQLSDIVSILALHEGPVILAGDFNAWNTWRLKRLKQYTSSLALKAVEFDAKRVTQFAGFPLDYVFYRGLHIKNQSVVEVDSSDHNLLHVHFSL